MNSFIKSCTKARPAGFSSSELKKARSLACLTASISILLFFLLPFQLSHSLLRLTQVKIVINVTDVTRSLRGFLIKCLDYLLQIRQGRFSLHGLIAESRVFRKGRPFQRTP